MKLPDQVFIENLEVYNKCKDITSILEAFPSTALRFRLRLFSHLHKFNMIFSLPLPSKQLPRISTHNCRSYTVIPRSSIHNCRSYTVIPQEFYPQLQILYCNSLGVLPTTVDPVQCTVISCSSTHSFRSYTVIPQEFYPQLQILYSVQ